MICPHCHKEHAEGAAFCPTTGKVITSPAGKTSGKRWGCAALVLLVVGLLAAAGYWAVTEFDLLALLSGDEEAVDAGAVEPTEEIPEAPTSVALTMDNIGDMVEIERLGRGIISECAVSPDGGTLALASSTGVWLYYMENLELLDQWEHVGNIRSITWSPDGKKLATHEWGTTILRIWDAESGAELDSFNVQTHYTGELRWSPDGKNLALISSTSGTTNIRVWDAATGELIARIDGHTELVRSIDWSPDGRQLVSGSADGTVRIWNIEEYGKLPFTKTYSTTQSGKTQIDLSYSFYYTADEFPQFLSMGFQAVYEEKEPFASLTLDTPDGRTIRLVDLAVRSETSYPISRDAALTRRLGGIDPHIGLFADPESPDPNNPEVLKGRYTLRVSVHLFEDTGDVSANIYLNRELLPTFGGELVFSGHSGHVKDVAWSPNGGKVVSAGDDGIRIWNAENGDSLNVPEEDTSNVDSVGWSPDGKSLAYGNGDGSVHIWDVINSEEVSVFFGGSETIFQIAWSLDGSQIISLGRDTFLRKWDVVSGEQIAVVEGFSKRTGNIAWSPDGSRLASVVSFFRIQIWDVSQGEVIAVSEGHTDRVNGMAWSPDGSQLATGSWDRTIRIWDANSGEQITQLEGHRDWVDRLAWSPDGSQLASGGLDGTVRIWDVSAGNEVMVLETQSGWVTSLVWSQDGSQVIAGDNDRIDIWNAESGELVSSLEFDLDYGSDLGLSSDGSRQAFGDSDGIIHILDTTSGEQVAVMEGYTRQVRRAAWSPDGMWLASGGFDNMIYIWDITSNEQAVVLNDHTDVVDSVAWSPDGTLLASGGVDGTIRIWGVPEE